MFLGYASGRRATLIHRRLYLPRHGVEDPSWAKHRWRCGVPPARTFQTQPQLAAAADAAHTRGAPCPSGTGRGGPTAPSAWQRPPLPGGRLDPLSLYALRVVASRHQLLGPDVWLLLRRHPDTRVLKTYLAHGPADLSLDTLVWLAGMR